MISTYLLKPEHYTLKNVLSLKLCAEHTKLSYLYSSTGKLIDRKTRIFHYFMSVAEYFPIIGQIVSLFELIIVRTIFYFTPSPPEIKNKLTEIIPLPPPIKNIVREYIGITVPTEYKHNIEGLLYYNNFIENTHFDLSTLQFSPTDRDLLYLIDHCPQITHLTIPHADNLTNKGLYHLLKATMLTHLRLVGRSTYYFSIAKITLSDQLKHLTIQNAMIFQSNDYQNLANLKNLQFLELLDCKGLRDESLQHLIHLPNLEYLCLRNCCELSITGLNALTQLKQLKGLALTSCPALTDKILIDLIQNMPNLEYLDLSYCTTITSEGVRKLAKLSNLKNLSLSSWDKYLFEPTPVNETLTILSENLSNLEYLDLSRCRNLTNDNLHYLFNLTKLKSLSLRANSIKYEALLNLVENLPNLEYLDIGMCNRRIKNHFNFPNRPKLKVCTSVYRKPYLTVYREAILF